jgi:two-component system OmpR family sensor kinase
MFSSIRFRLTLSYLGVIVLAMSLSGFLLLSFLHRYFLRATEDSLITQGRIAAQVLIPGSTPKAPPGEIPAESAERLAPVYNTAQQRQLGNLALQTENLSLPSDNLSAEGAPSGALDGALDSALSSMDLSYLADVSLQFSTQLETRLRILDAQGSVLVDSQQADQGTDLSDDPLVTQALNGQYASRTDEIDGEITMFVVLPVFVEDRLVGLVYLGQPLSDVAAVLDDLRTRLLLSAAIALSLSAIVGLVLSQAIARPLRRLTAVAGAVAQGQFDQQVPVRSRDEIGRLSRAFNDMTARLRAARQMQTDFVADVSHELRTPLTSIKGMVETLRDGAIDDAEVRDRFLETAENETNRLIRLVNDLLLLSRVDSEALNLQRQSRDLLQLVQATVERLTPQAEARQLVLKVETDSGIPLVWVDADRVQQVLVNLLDNAIKYSRPGDTVTLKVAAGPGHSARVQVCDQGLGIPAEDLPHVGQRFYRADKARSRAGGGSGLGLAIAQSLVQAHGGRLWLESREGEGTVVSFTLPYE